MGYVIGIDGGGTKTTYSICRVNSASSDQDSIDIVSVFEGKGTNPQSIGFNEMTVRIVECIESGLKRLSIPPDQVCSICCGLAGVGRKEDEEKVFRQLSEAFPSIGLKKVLKLMVCSDLFIALKGALKPGVSEGVLVIAGTGSNAIGIAGNDSVYKSGGWGHILGDEGSGYQIGLSALNAITRSFDQRGKETLLTELILKDLKLASEKDLITYIYTNKPEKSEIAGLAKQVIIASEMGDEISIHILTKAADELVHHVKSLFVQSNAFQRKTNVATAGSIFTYSKIVRERFIEEIQRKELGVFQESYQSPAYGAVVAAKEQCESINIETL